MSLKHNEVNPLAVQGLRELNFCPKHFQKVTFDLATDAKNITDWLYENTDGRFYAGQVVISSYEDESIKPKSCFCIGFEVHAEASYFALLLDTINVSAMYI